MNKAKVVAMLVALIGPLSAMAGYNANMSGKVVQVLTYTANSHIYFRLDNQPSSHPACQTDFFSIDASVPEDRRQQVLSRLLMAYANGESVNIGFDSTGDCSHGRIRVHRVG